MLLLRAFPELNMSARGHGGSSSSLPGCPAAAGEAGHQANDVLSWAVCFEKLLEDPVGVRYFTVRDTDAVIPGRSGEKYWYSGRLGLEGPRTGSFFRPAVPRLKSLDYVHRI